ncbi:MAG: hypothetical protein H0X29_11665 [Parachlamydiaceae bacterium]|nr:hypothetical protein [Parachlamydiaceae bacterium]
MSINYYNSVLVSSVQQKEQPLSFTNMLYKCGDKFAKLSSMYGGKSYKVIFNNTKKTATVKEGKDSFTLKHSLLQKLSAAVGACLKNIAGYFNKDIKIAHLVVERREALIDAAIDKNFKEHKVAIIRGHDKLISKNTLGEGADVGPELMLGCCVECCKACCNAR